MERRERENQSRSIDDSDEVMTGFRSIDDDEVMTSHSNQFEAISSFPDQSELDRFAAVANKAADAAGEAIRKYFRKPFDIIDKEDSRKPLFGTLIALLHKGKPVLGIIDQPILRERWIGISGRRTVMNGQEVSTRSCAKLSQAYLYTTSPHHFSEDGEVAFARVGFKVKAQLYGCDCYAYALLALGCVDIVMDFGLEPFDFLALIPVVEGAGGVTTDWKGHQLQWDPTSHSSEGFTVLAAGDKELHQQAVDSLQWT
ncbi:hypothetical protein RHGRI_013525 [Rhododendron griersonianum]|uniref:Histidinol-phosphatase n=1 Tax=Rhododendron griersonianum TaxID=479676 RepID=A0AAV6K616_9ERIC|nr:hypothetical protein RHGRI_013525 [Rhododendron griersonianum]